MKRHGYLYDKFLDRELIRQAIMKAKKDKTKRSEVKKVLDDVPGHVEVIYEMFKNKTFVPCVPIEKVVKEGSNQKERVITIIDFFPDQVIHWCIILVLEPIISRSAYTYSCGCMVGRGPHYGKKHIERWIQSDRKKTKYVAKLDIEKFYHSVKRDVIKSFLKTKIKDKEFLNLVFSIIDSYPRGLPIGFLTSQWLANWMLQGLDYFIKQTLKIKYYVRYMDDLVLFCSNKKNLHRAVKAIAEFLKTYRLKLKYNWQVFRLKCRALDFMGFRFFLDRTILRKSLMLRITRAAFKILRKGWYCVRDASRMISYMGWFKHSDAYRVYLEYIKPHLSIKRFKRVVSRYHRGEIDKCDRFTVRKRRVPQAC